MVKKKVFNTLLISFLLVLGVYFVYAVSFSISDPTSTEFYTRQNFSITCASSNLIEGYDSAVNMTNITLRVWNSTAGGSNPLYEIINTSEISSGSYSFTINASAFYNINLTKINIANVTLTEINYTYACAYGFRDGLSNISTNNTFIIDNTAPYSLKINITSQEGMLGNGSVINFVDNTSVQFSINVSDINSVSGIRSPTVNCSLIIDSTVKNSSIIINNNSIGKIYWFNVSVKDTFDSGYHMWNVTCYDKANNMNETARFHYAGNGYIGGNFTLTDTIGPTSTLTLGSSSIAKDAAATITCSATDTISPTTALTYEIKVTNPSGSISTVGGSSLSYTSTSTVGSYKANCRSIDSAGNWGGWTADQTFTVSSSVTSTSSGGTSSSSSSTTPTITETTEVESGQTENLGTLTQTIANNVIMGAESVATFTMATSNNIASAESHSVTVSEITDTSVTLIVQSDPVTVELNIGDIKTVDVDKDGTSDLEITLNDIIDGNADLTINTLINVPEVEQEEPEVEPTITEPEAKSSIGWWIALIIIVIGLVVWFLFKKKK